MRTMTKHIINVCLAVCTLLAVSCSSNDDTPPGAEESRKTLVLRIGTVGQSRASAVTTPEKELMHSLRIIILGRDNRVEHNYHTSFDGMPRENYIHSILNLPPGQKTIYLVANEESVEYIDKDGSKKPLTEFLAAIKLGDTDARDKMNGLYFEPDYTQPIPISARHDLFIPVGSDKMERDLYMVRVATKFSVTFLNYRDDPVTIKDFTISSVADQNYLMARLNEENPMFAGYPSWIEWLKYVSDISQENPYDPDLADQCGWVKDYELPAGTDKEITYSYNRKNDATKYISVRGYDEAATPAWGETKVEDIYIPESICLKTGQPEHGDQEYTMTFDIVDGPDKELSYPLPNLRALFRNTHVLVLVRMNQTSDDDNFLEVRVRTWEQGDQVDNGYWEEVTD